MSIAQERIPALNEASEVPPRPDGLPQVLTHVLDTADKLALPYHLKAVSLPAITLPALAAALDVEEDFITRTVVYIGQTTKKPMRLIISGRTRVNERALAALVGEVLHKATPAQAQRLTGYDDGVIPPIGLERRLPVILDEHLLRLPRIWCHAGVDSHVINVPTLVLARTISARVAKLA